jgi:crotonobetaine/carnitine-CoA ligase
MTNYDDYALHFAGLDAGRLLAQRARQRPDHPFLIWAPFDAPEHVWTYAAFSDAVARIAGGLSSRGISPGDRVLVHLENCPELLLTWFACAHLGAVCVPCNAMAAGPELAYFAQLTGACAAVTQPRFAQLLSQHCAGLKWIAVTETDCGAAPAHGTAPQQQNAFSALYGAPLPEGPPRTTESLSVMFTTGTTSRPKGVLWTHANALWAARLGATQQALRADDVFQVFLPLFHVVGLAWAVLPTLWAGATLLLQPKFSASRFWDTALRYRATVAAQVQFTIGILKEQPVPAQHSFRQWGNAVSLPDHESTFRVRMVCYWGMTEMVSQPIIGDPWSPTRPRAIGRPSLGYDLRVLDDDGRPVKAGEPGNLMVRGVRGVSVMAGYYNDPAATAAAFDEAGFFKTGDRVIVHDDGFIQFCDRAKDMLKVGGENVSAAEVERVVLETPGVREAAVVGRADPVWGEVAIVFVTLAGEPSDRMHLADQIIERCKSSLAKFKVPREVLFVDDLPRIGFGKVAKAQLRAILSK